MSHLKGIAFESRDELEELRKRLSRMSAIRQSRPPVAEGTGIGSPSPDDSKNPRPLRELRSRNDRPRRHP
jgi:hypothetical protein